MLKERLQGFEAHCEYGLSLHNQAGMAVSIVQDDRILFSGGFGFRDFEQKRKVDDKTLFPIGSSTKSFTAAAVQLLAQRGKLDLDKPLQSILPELVFMDADATKLVTTRDLLCHRTGLPRHDMIWVLRPYISRQELPALIRHLKPSAGFRSIHQYNNLMYACLGRIVEVVDGRTWEDFIEQEFLQPLEMNTACFTPDAAIVNGNFSLAYELDRKTNRLVGVPYSRLGGMAPAGAIHANVLELANWSSLQLNKGRYKGTTILEENRSEELHKPQMPIHEGLFDFPEVGLNGYAMGWESETFRGKTLIQHAGNVAGSSALVSFMPELNASVNVLVNTGSSLMTYAVMYDAFDRLMGFSGKNWADKMVKTKEKLYAMIDAAHGKAKEPPRPQKTTHSGAEFEGSYQHAAYGTIFVTTDDEGHLFLSFTGHKMKLENIHFDIFSANLELDYHTLPLQLSFRTEIDGSIGSVEINLEHSVEPVSFKRIP